MTNEKKFDASSSTNVVGRVHDPNAGSQGGHHHGRKHRADDGNAFLADPYDGGAAKTNDDLAEMLAEDFVSSATNGEPMMADDRDQEQEAEEGGPFVETTGREEFAHGVDKSNPKSAEREPVPAPMRGGK